MTLAALPESNTFERDLVALAKSAGPASYRQAARTAIIGTREVLAEEVREVTAGLSHRAKVLDLPVTIDDVLRELDRLAERIEP